MAHWPSALGRSHDVHFAGSQSGKACGWDAVFGESLGQVDDRLVDYINKVVRRTREWPQFHMGASPRAGLALMQAARTLAAFSGRDYAVPDDVFQVAGNGATRPRVAVVTAAPATPAPRVAVGAPRSSRLQVVSGGGS